MHHPTLRKVPSIKGKSWTSSLFNLAGCYQNLTPLMRKLPTEVQKDVMHMATLKTSYSYMQILVSTKHVFCHFSCMVARFGQTNASKILESYCENIMEIKYTQYHCATMSKHFEHHPWI